MFAREEKNFAPIVCFRIHTTKHSLTHSLKMSKRKINEDEEETHKEKKSRTNEGDVEYFIFCAHFSLPFSICSVCSKSFSSNTNFFSSNASQSVLKMKK
jgi:hypothetical protein